MRWQSKQSLQGWALFGNGMDFACWRSPTCSRIPGEDVEDGACL